MDILDIDEALKDDSFIFLEDKTHDDVSNILQQWKTNNQEQAFKLNSRTFTRPKRKLAQNLEAQFPPLQCNVNSLSNAIISQRQQQQQHQQQNGVVNLEIGGLVTTMQKSFLQDTSPPSSICSSMEVSMDRMNASLVTSADFTNVSFLQSTRGLDFDDPTGGTMPGLYFNERASSDGYTLSDMIRDRKALESLTLSGESTLIKDSNIGQIDEISLMSKTASGCSTMDNSTESMDATASAAAANRTCNLVTGEMVRTFNRTFEAEPVIGRFSPPVAPDDMIGNTTFNLVESSICMDPVATVQPPQSAPPPQLNATIDYPKSMQHQQTQQDHYTPATGCNETFRKPSVPTVASATNTINNIIELDSIVCLAKHCDVTIANGTFDCNNTSVRCETPENQVKNSSFGGKFYEQSTPQQNSTFRCKQQFTPSIKIAEVNISPIVGPSGTPTSTRVLLNETFENSMTTAATAPANKIKSDTFCEKNALTQAVYLTEAANLAAFEKMEIEMLENVENPNETYTHDGDSSEVLPNQIEQQEANILLVTNEKNEEEFDHLLDNISRIELNAEQIKMRKSLATIKKRFTYGVGDKSPCNTEAKEVPSPPLQMTDSSGDLTSNSIHATSLMASGSGSAAGAGMQVSGAGDHRLLSRRSRLYDDINLSFSAKSSSASFIVQQPTVVQAQQQSQLNVTIHGEDPEGEEETESRNRSRAIESDANSTYRKTQKTEDELNEITSNDISSNTNDASTTVTTTDVVSRATVRATKLEKRERDRDRFKTIRIIKRYDEVGSGDREFNVPCIDDYEDDSNSGQVTSAVADNKTPTPPGDDIKSFSTSLTPHVFNNNKYEFEQSQQQPQNNYATFKKPKEKPLRRTEVQQVPAPVAPERRERSERSLSRPRYISGLQKFSTANKAISAGDLEKTIAKAQPHPPSVVTGANFNRTQPNELKSPMGIKSKSFHNLSSNFGFAAPQPPSSNATTTKLSGLKKSLTGGSVLTEKQAKGNSTRTSSTTRIQAAASVKQQPSHQKINDDSVFKVPSLVSGLRAPSATTAKRTGLIRPSSGYYSLSLAKVAADVDSDAGRHSPTDSMSSASSRGSISNGLKPSSNGAGSGGSITSVSGESNSNLNGCTVQENNPLTSMKTAGVTTTGISKPSGLRAPSNIKRSGLPRPSSIARR